MMTNLEKTLPIEELTDNEFILRRASLPPDPYKGLAYYDREDRLLFAGREDHVDQCVQFLAEPNTRMLILHGRTGCGKSSFLRAGLIPELEERGFGFQFLQAPPVDKDSTNDDERPVFVRCGADPISRIAEVVYRFALKPRKIPTALGPRTLNLSEALLEHESIESFIAACKSRGVLLQTLTKLSSQLMHTLVIVLDQSEEVITLTKPLDTSRKGFFRFLRDFHAINIDIKLVIALRKEHFGEFLGLAELDASLKTEARHFLLPDLEFKEVLRAITLPTDKVARFQKNSPYDSYGFEYETDVAEILSRELFKTLPAGGVLPVMQIVCRDLYNEVRARPRPWIIDKRLFESGKGITGRVDRHISHAIKHALDIDVRSSLIGDKYEEESRWRKGLLGLVRREADGTVKTDHVSEDGLRQRVAVYGVKGNVDSMLEQLSRAETLVLRRFSVLSIESLQEEVFYSLGHDAIGLALYEWKLRADEVDHRRTAERATKKWTSIAVSTAIVGLGATAAGMYFVAQKQARLAETEISVLQSTADRLRRSDPKLAALFAVEAAYQADQSNRWFWPSKGYGSKALREILSQIPIRKIPVGKVDMDTTEPQIKLLPKQQAFLKDSGDKFEIESLKGSLSRQFKISLGSGDDLRVLNVTEVDENLMLLEIANEIIVIGPSGEIKKFNTEYFESNAKNMISLINKEKKINPDENSLARKSFFLDGESVHFYRRVGGYFFIQEFNFNAGAKNGPTFTPGALFQASNDHSLSAFGRYVLDIEDVMAAKNRVTFKEARILDLSDSGGPRVIWSSKSDDKHPLLSSCTQPDTNVTCEVRPLNDRSKSQYIMLKVLVTARSENSSSNGSQQETIIIIDPVSGKSAEVSLSEFDKLAGALGPTEEALPLLRHFDRKTLIAQGPSINDLKLIRVQGRSADIFLVEGGKVRYLRTLLSGDLIDTIALTNDGKTIMAGAGGQVVVWHEKAPAFDELTTQALIEKACQLGIVGKIDKPSMWIDATGLMKDPPPSRCIS